MRDISEFLESGLIESYVLGMATPEEVKEVEQFAMSHPEINEAIELFSVSLEQHAFDNAINPDPIIKPLLMATIDYIDRMEKGEAPSFPPNLSENSTISDYSEWLNRPDFVLPTAYNAELYAKLIAFTPQVTTAVVWIEQMAPQEVHDDEYEKFLIIEGTCDITIEDEVHHLKSGDYLAIPLHKNHTVKVTSTIRCKAILQRVAA